MTVKSRLALACGVALVVALLVVAYTAAPTNSDGCKKTGQNYQVLFSHNQVEPTLITGKLCDQITFTNRDKTVREVAFGSHEHHVAYDGVIERVLSQNQSFSVTLNKTGTYHFHDHFHDELQGDFRVSK